MNITPDNILKITEERLESDPKISKKNIKKTSGDLINTLYEFDIPEEIGDLKDAFPIDFIKTKNTDLIPTSSHPDHPKQRKYPLELEDSLVDIEHFNEHEDIAHALPVINSMIKKYKNTLVTEDYIMLLLTKARMLNNNHDIAGSMHTLKELEAYEEYFMQDDKNLYYLTKWNNLYDQAVKIVQENPKTALNLFFQAREAFALLLSQKVVFEDTWYKHVMFRSALCYYKIGDMKKCDAIFSEIRTIDDKSNNATLTVPILYMHGLVYQKLKQYQKAIATFKEYLSYNPEDEEVKHRIRVLSEKPGE